MKILSSLKPEINIIFKDGYMYNNELFIYTSI